MAVLAVTSPCDICHVKIARLEEIVKSLAKVVDLEKQAAEKALNLALITKEVRITAVEKFSADISKLRESAVMRSDFEREHDLVLEQVKRIELRLADWNGRILAAGAGVAIITSLLTFMLSKLWVAHIP